MKNKLEIDRKYKQISDKKEALEELKESLRSKNMGRLQSLFSRYQKSAWEEQPVNLETDLSESIDLDCLDEMPEEIRPPEQRHVQSTSEQRTPFKTAKPFRTSLGPTLSGRKSTSKLPMPNSASKVFK